MKRNRPLWAAVSVLSAAALVLAGCTSDDPDDTASSPGPTADDTGTGTGEQSEFFEQAEYDRQVAMLEATPEGPSDAPWEQAINPEMADTSEYAADGPYHLCFSNAGLFNPWRQVGFKTMQAEVELHQDQIPTFTVLDAEGTDDKQISDINDLLARDCDLLIVSPNTTATLTPAVEAACEQVPVIVFDRGVNTDCPVTFINPIGGYAYGHVAAEFLIDEVEPGGKILALRISPGVDVLEHRWSAAKVAFDNSELDVVGVEFTEGDPANTKSIVSDYIAREGQIDGVWMDSGATSVAAVEAFEDAGMDIPPITGEDQQDFLQKWSEEDLTAIAPTYPTFQWRTPIIAALQILAGEQVPAEWKLPQPTVTGENLDQYLQPNMPPLHYALCGCEDLPGFPERWQ